MSELLSIGQVATATRTTIVALRHYDALGLIDVVERVGGKRRFASETIGRVNFVRRAQDAGFSLAEIGAILDDDRSDRLALLDAKLDEMRDKQARIAEMIDLLAELRDCGCEAVDRCPTVFERAADASRSASTI